MDMVQCHWLVFGYHIEIEIDCEKQSDQVDSSKTFDGPVAHKTPRRDMRKFLMTCVLSLCYISHLFQSLFVCYLNIPLNATFVLRQLQREFRKIFWETGNQTAIAQRTCFGKGKSICFCIYSKKLHDSVKI